MINNDNWTERSWIWSEIIRVISKSNERAARVRLEITSMFQTKIARPEVQLPLYYIHFEIAQFNSLNTRTTRTIKVAKYEKQWPFCISFSCNVIG